MGLTKACIDKLLAVRLKNKCHPHGSILRMSADVYLNPDVEAYANTRGILIERDGPKEFNIFNCLAKKKKKIK